MEQESIMLNGHERDRLKVLHEAKKRHIRQREAAEQVGLTERQVRRLLGRMRKEGDRAVVHKRRGRRSNRKIAVEVERQAVALVRAEYRDFGPTLAAEYLGPSMGWR